MHFWYLYVLESWLRRERAPGGVADEASRAPEAISSGGSQPIFRISVDRLSASLVARASVSACRRALQRRPLNDSSELGNDTFRKAS